MPYDSNGNFTLNAGYLAVAGQVIQPSQHNPPLEDLAANGLSNAVVRDGRAAMTGNLKMGAFKVTGMADGTAATDGATKGQMDTALAGVLTNVPAINGGPLGGLLNAVINGSFDVAKRGTFLAAGTGFKYVTDRWARVSAGSTLAFSRQEFSPGVTTPPGNTRYFGRFTVASVASATNYAAIYHAMEDVRTYAGKTVTVTFYAKADAAKNIGFELYQWFGLGGSPSSAVTGIGAQQCALTTSWQRFDILVNVPSISGKTRGTDNNDHLELVFWFDAGSTFASRASSIGQQSGTYDITRVSVREGDCRQEVDPFCPRPIGLEETLCARYFQTFSDLIISGYNTAGGTIYGQTLLSPQMRGGNASPVFVLNGTSSSNASTLSLNSGNSQRVRAAAIITATAHGHILYDLTADFEI